MKRERLERAMSVILTFAALAVAVSFVRQSFFPPSSAVATTTGVPDFIPYWQDALDVGIRSGSSTAPVTIVELTDLECPACRGFEATLREVLAENPTDVAHVYVSYPLPQHRFSLQAARAAECANDRGRFRELVALIYEKQDSLGLKSWGSYAHEAGLSDSAAIAECATSTESVSRIVGGKDFGARIHITGTPTVIVNGWRFPYTPSKDDLTRAIDSLRRGKSPVDTASLVRADT